MLGGLALILGLQLVGEVFVRALGLPIPGPVIGMVLFFVWLRWRTPRDSSSTVRAGDMLVNYLPIMFVPTTVGVIVYGPMIASQWMPAVVASFGTWLLTFVLVAWVAVWLRPRRPSQEAA